MKTGWDLKLHIGTKDILPPIPLDRTVEVRYVTQRKAWEFPKERFVTYEPSDELWARPLGFGREVVREETITIPNAFITRLDQHGCDISGLAKCEVLDVRSE